MKKDDIVDIAEFLRNIRDTQLKAKSEKTKGKHI